MGTISCHWRCDVGSRPPYARLTQTNLTWLWAESMMAVMGKEQSLTWVEVVKVDDNPDRHDLHGHSTNSDYDPGHLDGRDGRDLFWSGSALPS
jgi:hypothetical protein